MTRQEIETLWKAPRNWKWGVYYCKADPRVIVPKRLKWMGWTVNAARPSAIPVVLPLIAIMAGPIFLVAAMGAGNCIVLVTAVLSIAIMCLLCAYLSSRTE